MPLPRNGDELAQMIMARLRWYAYRIRFHPWTTDELPKILGTMHDYVRLMRLDRPVGHSSSQMPMGRSKRMRRT